MSQICHLFRVHREAFGLKVDERDEDLPKQMRMANRLVIRVVDK